VTPARVAEVRARIDALESEARAAAGDSRASASPLFAEVGALHEHELGDVVAAIDSYQRAWLADPSHAPVLRAARRLFTQRTKWGMVLLLLDAELALPGAPTALLLIEKARHRYQVFSTHPDQKRVAHGIGALFVRRGGTLPESGSRVVV
jgi:hypothetical protein